MDSGPLKNSKYLIVKEATILSEWPKTSGETTT